MKCPVCQTESHEEAKYCSDCGYALRAVRKDMEEDAVGNPSYTPKFLKESFLTSKSAIEGERKVVTVLFADVVNSTSFAERLDPEEVHAIMDGCFKILMEEVHKYGGTINQFRGDGIMALFGAPYATENHAQRAGLSALGIQDVLKVYGDELKARFGIDFMMRIGLSSGSVVVGSIGDELRMDYTADGDTTNLASRMESMAKPGTVLVTKDTYKKSMDQLEFRSMGKVSVKGKKGPLEVYELKGKRSPGPQVLGARRIYSELVGRKKELNLLEFHVLKVLNGEGSIINLVGEAGIGKSRLIGELKKKETVKRVTLLEGRSLAIGRNLSFHPIIDILKSWAGIREEETEAESLRKLEQAVRLVYPKETGEVLPFIATIMGLKSIGKYAERVKGIEGVPLEKLILKNMRDLIARASRFTPIVFILEDLQWSDLTTIEFLESLFKLAEDHRVLFINVFRSGYRETGDRLLETVRTRHPEISLDIHLDPLNRNRCETLITNLTKARRLPNVTRRRIIRRAEGNPFFIEEVVRSFIDEGVMEPESGTFTGLNGIDSVTIPENIRDVIMARIDRLDEDTKDLLKVASVIGRHFFREILVKTIGSIQGIDERIEYLKEIQLIRERETMGEVEYLFKHGLTQEATYQSILLNTRTPLHLKVARVVESVFPDKLHAFYGILAYHYSKGENLQKAEEYLLKAGEEAARSSASGEALNYYHEALKLYLHLSRYREPQDPEKVSMLEKNIGFALFNKGRYTEALIYFDRVLERWGVRSPKNRITERLGLISDLLRLIIYLYLPLERGIKTPDKRDHETFSLMEKKLISLAFIEPRRYFVEFLRSLSWARPLDIMGIPNGPSRYSGASALFSWTGFSFTLSRKILEYMEDLINREDPGELLDYKLYGLYYDYFVGNWKKHADADQPLLDHNLKMGKFWQVSTYLFFISSIKVDQGLFEEAQGLIEKLSEIWEADENENTREYIYSLRIRSFLKARRLHEARIEVEEAISFASHTCRELASLYYVGLRAIIEVLQRKTQDAHESLLQAREIRRREDFSIPLFMSSYLTGQFMLDLHLLEEAVLSNATSKIRRHRRAAAKSGKQALKNCRKYASDRIEIYRLMGVYHWLIQRQDKATQWWRRSMEAAEGMGARLDLPRTHMEIGKRLSEKRSRSQELDGITSSDYLEKARARFEQMQAWWDVEEVGKVIAFRQQPEARR